MRKYLWCIIILSVSFIIGIGCQKRTNEEDNRYIDPTMICGSWSMELDNQSFKGKEEINLLPSNVLIVKDSLIFRGEDSGFEFILPLKVNLEGWWHLVQDSLFIKYRGDYINIETDEDNMMLSNTQENADLKAFDSLKKEMGGKLATYVYSFLFESYQRVSDKDLFFGQIQHLKDDTLIFNNNNNIFYLKRISIQ